MDRKPFNLGKAFLLITINAIKKSELNHVANHACTDKPPSNSTLSIVVDATGGLVLPVGGVVREGFGAHAAHL